MAEEFSFSKEMHESPCEFRTTVEMPTTDTEYIKSLETIHANKRNTTTDMLKAGAEGTYVKLKKMMYLLAASVSVVSIGSVSTSTGTDNIGTEVVEEINETEEKEIQGEMDLEDTSEDVVNSSNLDGD